MTTVAIRNIAEAFFRHWFLYLAIFGAAVGLGVVAVVNSTDEYTASGSVFVDTQSLVANQIGVRDAGGFSFLSPAQFTSQELNGLVSTEVFIDAALERAGVDLDPDPVVGRAQVDRLRASVNASAGSENLVAVTVTTPDPELSFRVADGVIEEFVRFKIDLDVTESGASEQFFAELVESYEQDLDDARDAVTAALRGATDLEELSLVRQLEVERLQQEEQLVEERYTSAVESLEISRLATLQTETDVRQRYSVFDPPVIPVEPNGGLFDDVVVVFGAAIVGLGLALLATLIGAAMNRAVTFADDLTIESVGASVVAVLPRVKKRELALSGAVVDLGGDGGDPSERLGQQTITIVPVDEGDGPAGPSQDLAEQALSASPAEQTPQASPAEQAPTPSTPPATAPVPPPAPPGAAPAAAPVPPPVSPQPIPVPDAPSAAPAEAAAPVAEQAPPQDLGDGGLAIVDAAPKATQPAPTVPPPVPPPAPAPGAAETQNIEATEASTTAESPAANGSSGDTEPLTDEMEKLLQTTSLGEDWQLPEPPGGAPKPQVVGTEPIEQQQGGGDAGTGGHHG